MTLRQALGLEREKMVCLIGAGGKTTTLYRLAGELWKEGGKVLVSTTTRIFKPTLPHIHKLYLAEELEALRGELANIRGASIVGAGRALDGEGKLIGLPAGWFNALRAGDEVDWMLIEADGAASRPFKVPLEHEPVVPQACLLTLWVMGIKVLARPLSPQWVHRAERAAALLGVRIGVPITQDLVLRLLAHPQGCLKGVPSSSRIVVLINQADGEGEIGQANKLGRAMIRQGIERVVITSYLARSVVREVITG